MEACHTDHFDANSLFAWLKRPTDRARTLPAVPARLYAQAQVGKLATDLENKLEAITQLTVTQADYEAMEKEVVSMAKELEDRDKKLEAKDNLEVSKLCGSEDESFIC